LINPSDDFSISYKDIKLLATQDQKYLDYYTKKIIFEEQSAKKILDKEKEILSRLGACEKKF